MNNHKKFFSKIGTNYLILGILSIILQIILVNIINATNPTYIENINILTGLSSLCNYILPFPIFYWLMKKLKSQKIEKNSVGIKTFITYIAITVTLMWIGNIIGLVITNLLSGAIQSEIANPVQELINSNDIIINLVIISIIAPIFEEIFFRKFLIDRSIRYGARVSIILSATLFAFFHGNLNQFFYAFLMGGFFAYVYIKTGKITYTIILHAIINLMGSVVSLIIQNSISNLQNAMNTADLTIIIIYMSVLLIFLFIGFLSLLQYKKAKFNGEKTEINLKHPYRTMFLNYGMVFFIGFYVFEMIRQVLG
ncbi:CPBP family intramembrane glutamic endopeptidase [Methanobrevibacter sp.]